MNGRFMIVFYVKCFKHFIHYNINMHHLHPFLFLHLNPTPRSRSLSLTWSDENELEIWERHWRRKGIQVKSLSRNCILLHELIQVKYIEYVYAFIG